MNLLSISSYIVVFQHLFGIWFSMVLQDSGSNISIKDWITKWLTNGSSSEQIGTLIFTTAWFIWKGRCSSIFQDKQVNYVSVARNAIRMQSWFYNRLIFWDFSLSSDYYRRNWNSRSSSFWLFHCLLWCILGAKY